MLRMFENAVLRKIFGHRGEECNRRLKKITYGGAL
jgi:hypothetical protein